MASVISSLDIFCEALAASFDNANLALAAMPRSQSDVMAELRYSAFDGSSLVISLAELYPQRCLALHALQFHVRCYRIRHTLNPYAPARDAIALRPPPWWQRMRQPALAIRLDIHIIDGELSIAFRRAAPHSLRRAKSDWIFLLTPEQERKIDMLRPGRKHHGCGRLAADACLKWLRRLTGNVMP
ncbi:hypothetical protein BCF11_1873 [Collimonas sp. PA-H2]|uniref:hypothetical protein n=1 Tax=Collimonas sp. PA-H2 TaxID=1881062 RepID=UPI000BF5360F|nr:hypothetical protein [Collimonas sp. PA-H2]PFH09476.1 hypothetical protein BCF11_1873 [Collimonas sp. PA-H2]